MTTPTFLQRVQQCYEQLSPNARKVANYLQQSPYDVLNTSVAEIAETTQTSKATVSRFFRQLGYESLLELKKELKFHRSTGYPSGQPEVEHDHLALELRRIQQTLENISKESIDDLVDAIIHAKRITLVGFRNSYPVALHFRQQLLQLRSTVRLLPQPGQTLSEELTDIHDEELVILIAFRRRPKVIRELTRNLKKEQVIMIADPSAQMYRSSVSQLLICQLGQELPLDSYAAPMSLVSAVCNAVMAKSEFAESRIKRISEWYQDLDELE